MSVEYRRFEPPDAARAWLRDNGFDDPTGDGDGDCILRRVVGTDGRSRAWINGRPVPLQSLRELGEQLVEICGQQDHQSLRHRGAQRQLLDGSAGLAARRDRVRALHAEWREAHAAEERLSEAVEHFSKAVELNPGDETAQAWFVELSGPPRVST